MADKLPIVQSAGVLEQLQVGDDLTVAAQKLTATSVLVVQPGGTGALQGNSTGNARGANATDWQRIRTATTQVASGSGSVIGGGQNNTADGPFNTVCGGQSNTVTSTSGSSGIGSGFLNTVSGAIGFAFIGGGVINSVSGAANGGFIGSGQGNVVTGSFGTICGGASNSVSNTGGVIVGGSSNVASGLQAFIGGGSNNTVTASNASALSGNNNTVNSTFATIAGGKLNQIDSSTAFIGGGENHLIGTDCLHATVCGGFDNDIGGVVANPGTFSTVVGGTLNRVTNSLQGFIGGGTTNHVLTSDNSTISGGTTNTIDTSSQATIGGGGSNGITVAGVYSTVGGGQSNSITGPHGSILGGQSNSVSGTHGSVPGGRGNSVTGTYAHAWGQDNAAQHAHSSASGHNAKTGNIGEVAHCVAIHNSTRGSGQASTLVLTNTTTDATLTNLFLDGIAAEATLPANSSWTFNILVNGLRTTGAEGAGYQFFGAVRRDGAGVATLIGAVVATTPVEDIAGWTAAVVVSGNVLRIQVTGVAAVSINWSAKIDLIQTIVEG